MLTRAILLTSLLGLGCGQEPVPSGPLAVWYDGCGVVRDVCEVPPLPEAGADGEPPAPPRITLWVDDPAPLRVTPSSLDAVIESVDGGQRVSFVGPRTPTTVSVRTATASWSMNLVPEPERPEADPERCPVPLEGPAESAEVVAQRVSCVFRAYREGALPDDVPPSRVPDLLVEAADAYAELGFETRAQSTLGLAAWVARADGRFARSEEIVRTLPESGASKAFWLRVYGLALVAREEREYDEADALLDEAARVAMRSGLPSRYLSTVRTERSGLLARLGRLDEALDLVAAEAARHPLDDQTCDQDALTDAESLAWHELLRRRAGLPPRLEVDPAGTFRRVSEAQERCGASASSRAVADVNLAIEAWSRGGWEEAVTAARRVNETHPSSLRALAHGVEARGWLALGDLDEASRAAALAADAAERGPPLHAEIFARLAVGEVAYAKGDLEAAEAQLVEAWEVLWDALPSTPSNVDRSAFVGTQVRVAPRLIGLLVRIQLDTGRPDEAFRTLRTARVRALRSLRLASDAEGLPEEARRSWAKARGDYESARDELLAFRQGRWSLAGEALASADAEERRLSQVVDEARAAALEVLGDAGPSPLRAPQAGEALVAWIPVGGRWMAFVETSEGTAVGEGPSEELEGEPLAAALVAAAEPFLDGRTRMTVLPWGTVQRLDLEHAPVGDGRLVDHLEVVWALDLPERTHTTADGVDLVVGDPLRDLPSARVEAEAVARALEVTPLVGEAATLNAVSGRLAEARRFHFAGHGRVDERVSWRTALALADAPLDVGAILALPRAPEVVVLSGCETGRASADTRVASLGLAQAFVLSGASVVVASDEPVDDARTADELGSLLALAHTPDEVVAEIARLQRTRPAGTASAWRAWVP